MVFICFCLRDLSCRPYLPWNEHRFYGAFDVGEELDSEVYNRIDSKYGGNGLEFLAFDPLISIYLAIMNSRFRV